MSSARKYILHIFLEYSIQQVYKNAILQGVGGNDGMGYLSTNNKQHEFEAEILLREKLIDINSRPTSGVTNQKVEY